MKKSLTMAVILALTQMCFGQSYQISDFTETPFPAYMSKDWYKLNNANILFAVRIEKRKLNIKNARYNSEKTEFKLPYGTLITQDFGEFGGGLYYKPNDTTKKTFYINGKADTIKNKIITNGRYLTGTPLNWLQRNIVRIKGGNVDTIFTYHGDLCCMEGLAHMGINDGSIEQLKIGKDSISFRTFFSFDDAPRYVSIYKNKLYVLSFGRLYIINGSTAELIIDNAIWRYMGVRSISVKDEDEIYIGMVGGYVKVKPSTKQMTFYKYNKL